MSKLQLSQTPDFRTPMRYFLTAPLFGLAAALLLAYQGTSGLESRWSPAALAATHLLTLGFLSMTITGALFQIFPVVLGVGIPGGRRLARWVHMSLSVGSALLAAGFLLPAIPLLIQLGLAALALAFGSFLAAVAAGLWRARSEHPVLGNAKYALAGHLVVVLLGLSLGLGYAGLERWPLDRSWTDLHAVWGLAGWLGLLVIGVAYEVVPMFQLTPPYPALMKSRLATGVAVTLILWSLGYAAINLGGNGAWIALRGIAGLLLAAGFVLFAMVTLYLQSRRKSREPDIFVFYWALGMICLVAGILGLFLADFTTVGSSAWSISASILLFLGFAVSVVNGMLYKIVPFLIWLHLTIAARDRGRSRQEVPNVKRILARAPAWIHFGLHCLGVTLLALAPIIKTPVFLWTATLSLASAFTLLWWTLFSAVRAHYLDLIIEE